MVVRHCGYLRQVRYADYLTVDRNLFKLYAHLACRVSAYTRINFVKYHCAYLIIIKQYAFNGKHNTGKLAARSNFRKWLHAFALIRRNHKFNIVAPVFGVSALFGFNGKTNLRHIKVIKYFADLRGKPFGRFFTDFRKLFTQFYKPFGRTVKTVRQLGYPFIGKIELFKLYFGVRQIFYQAFLAVTVV